MAFSLNKRGKTSFNVEPLWKFEHIVGNEFVTILLDRPIREVNPTDQKIFSILRKALENFGIESYVITSALRKYPTEDDLKKGLTTFYTENDPHWFEDIILPARAKGMVADVVIAFGPALYQITKTATDFTVEDLIYPYFENYVYVGHGFIGNYDLFVYPMFTVEETFQPGHIDKNFEVIPGCWKMNYMMNIFKKIANHQYKLPDEMGEISLHEIGANYDEDPSGAVAEVKMFLENHFNEEICAFDLETSGFNQWKDKIRCITLAFDSFNGYYIEWKIFRDNPELVKILSKMMKSCKHRVTVNGKFDIKFLWVNGLDLDIEITEDAMTLSHVLCSGRHKGLKTMAFYWTPFGGYDHELDVYKDHLKKKGNKDPSYYDFPKKILFPYATMDAAMTVRVWKAAVKRIHLFDEVFPTEIPVKFTGGHANTAWEWYRYIMMLYPIICRMEYEGLCVDEEIVEMHREIFRKEIEECRKELSKIFGTPNDFQYGSADQLGDLLERSGWPCHGRSKNGKYATSDECFTEWEREKMPGVNWLKKFRVANSCLKTYLGVYEEKVDQKKGIVKGEWTGWPQYIVHHDDGTARIHCNFTICGAETFRMISREPNLQNVPTRSQEGQITKMSFTVPPAAAYTITTESGKTYWGSELAHIWNGTEYVFMKDLEVGDKIEDVQNENTILEWDEYEKYFFNPEKKNPEKGLEEIVAKIEIDPHNKKAGKLCYLLMTQDAASLEARVATSDTAMNPKGIDPVLQAVYDPNSGYGEDLHSMTSFNTFAKSTQMQINEIEDENGKTWYCVDVQNMWVERDGKPQLVLGADLKETDKILGYEEDFVADDFKK